MPVVSHIDRNSKHPTKRYMATADSYRLQLAALPDDRDPETGRMKRGRNLVAQFKTSFFDTNKPEIIKLVADSYAFADGSIKDWDAMQTEAKEKRYAELKKIVSEDEELLNRLKGELVATDGVPDEKPVPASKPEAKPKAKSAEKK